MSNRRKTLALNNEIYQKSIANGAELIGSKSVVGATGAQGEIGLIGPTGAKGDIGSTGPAGPAAGSSNFVIPTRSISSTTLSVSYLDGLNYYLSTTINISLFEMTNIPTTSNQMYVFKLLIKTTVSTNYVVTSSIRLNLANAAATVLVPVRHVVPTAPAFFTAISQTITLYVLTSVSFFATSSISYQ